MDTQRLKLVLENRTALDINDDFGIENCWKQEVKIICQDIAGAIDFFLHECTDEEFFWLSEIFQDVAEQSHSQELVQCLQQRLDMVKEDSYAQTYFKNDYMKTYVNYATYVKGVQDEIDSAMLAIVE